MDGLSRALLLSLPLVLVAFAGCITDGASTTTEPAGDATEGGEQDPLTNGTERPTPDPEDAPLEPVLFGATGCDALVLLVVDDYDAIDDFLPAGFIPADFFSLLRTDAAAFLGQGATGPVIMHCQSNSLNQRPFDLVLAGTLVYTPQLAGINASVVDGYQDFVAISDPEVADLFEEFGWDVERGIDLDLSITVDEDAHDEAGDSNIPGAATGSVQGTWDGTTLLEGMVVASTTYHTSSSEAEHVRFWHDTPLGVSYMENTVDMNGKSGAATCSFGGRYAETFKRTDCEPGEAIGLVVADVELQTRLVRLHGIHA